MAKRSLKASPEGIIRAKKAFQRKGWTQEYLAAEVGLSTRQSIWKFFTGRPIERHLFVDICFQLDLEWQSIADLPPDVEPLPAATGLDNHAGVENWVVTLRSQTKEQIQAQCGILQSSFDMTQPLLLDSIYTNVNILPHLTNQRWLEVSDLQDSRPEVERPRLTSINQQVVAGIQAATDSAKLMILGKPGAGKTTFLQYLAIQCSKGEYKGDCIPIFIQLRNFVAQTKEEEDFSLTNYIARSWSSYQVTQEQVEILLQKGKLLVLLDGLDEVPKEYSQQVLKEIDLFANNYYQNQVIITCRIAAQQYYFRGFNYVEIADFDSSQIRTFAQKWFVANSGGSEEAGILLTKKFFEQLECRENQPIRELVATPILLSLICSVFQERATFPTKRSKLYQAGLDILLVRWDQARGIQRDQAYRNLSLADKIKLLSQIAAINFERGSFFFEKSEILDIISNHLAKLPNHKPDPETLWLDSEAILTAIELQHGLLVERARDIYSFSHLTFQEYLTARKIVASTDKEVLEESLNMLASHATNPQWQEVILLTSSMLPNADFLLQLIKKEIDKIFKGKEELRKFLSCLNQKVNSLDVSYHLGAVRAFYFTLFQDRDLNLALSLDPSLASDLSPDLALDLALARAFRISLILIKSPDLKNIINLGFALDLERNFNLEKPLQQALEKLKKELPDLEIGKEKLQSWWHSYGAEWVSKFRALLIEYRQIGYEWQFTLQQEQLLRKYYDSNKFMIKCLQSDCQVSGDLRQKIEDTTLNLP
ncbi:MAG: NACHT domain-containing NTPase [Spirulinaceae cyanobacterium]